MIRVQVTLFLLVGMAIQEVHSAAKHELRDIQEDTGSFTNICKDVKKVITELICADPDFAKASHEANGFSGTNKENKALVKACLQERLKKMGSLQKEFDDLLKSPYLNPLGYSLLLEGGGILHKENIRRGLCSMVYRCKEHCFFYPYMFEMLTEVDMTEELDCRRKIIWLAILATLTRYTYQVLRNYKNTPPPNPYFDDKNLITSIIKADKGYNKEALKILLEFEDPIDPLLTAISYKNRELTKLLLDHTADPHAVADKYFFYAIYDGSFEIVKLFLEYHPKLVHDDKNAYGDKSAIDVAKRRLLCKVNLSNEMASDLESIINHLENLETFSHSKNS